MGFLDFAPEPPAPSATPVTEHIDLNCAPSNDTRDLSSKTVPVVLPSTDQTFTPVLTNYCRSHRFNAKWRGSCQIRDASVNGSRNIGN